MAQDLIFVKDFLELAELKGQEIWLCRRAKIRDADLDRGIPTEYRFECDRVRGWLPDESRQQQAIKAGTLKAGEFQVLLSAIDFSPEALTPDMRIKYEGRLYKIEYVSPAIVHSKPMFHTVKIAQDTDEHHISVENPDPVIDW